MPVEFQDLTCPKPSDDVVSRIKKDTKAKKELKEALLYEQVDFEDETNTGNTRGRKCTPVTRSRQRMNPSVTTKKTTQRTNVSNESDSNSDVEDSNIVTMGDNITFVASSKKRKIRESPKRSKDSSSIVSGLQFVEEMGLITQPPLTSKKNTSQTDGSVNPSIDKGDVSTVDYHLSVVDSQPSEALPPTELPFLEDDRKLPAVIQKPYVDESVGGNSTELEKKRSITN